MNDVITIRRPEVIRTRLKHSIDVIPLKDISVELRKNQQDEGQTNKAFSNSNKQE